MRQINIFGIAVIGIVLITNVIALIKQWKNDPIWILFKVLADMISLIYVCTQ